MTVPIWIIPLLICIIIFAWVNWGFDYRGAYNFTGMFTLPLCLFLWALTWMIYFAYMYWSKS